MALLPWARSDAALRASQEGGDQQRLTGPVHRSMRPHRRADHQQPMINGSETTLGSGCKETALVQCCMTPKFPPSQTDMQVAGGGALISHHHKSSRQAPDLDLRDVKTSAGSHTCTGTPCTCRGVQAYMRTSVQAYMRTCRGVQATTAAISAGPRTHAHTTHEPASLGTKWCAAQHGRQGEAQLSWVRYSR